MKEEILNTKFWTGYFRTYDILNIAIPYDELLYTIIKKMELKEGDRVLDAGCGTGNLAMRITDGGISVLGIDSSEEALEIYKKKNANAEVQVHDITDKLPFPDNHFDKIALNNVLYTINPEKREEIAREFYRVLKKDGIVVVSDPNLGFEPMAIYKDHLKRKKEKAGFFGMFLEATKFVIPTIKIFYYNAKIKKGNAFGDSKFFDKGEHSELLKKAGFKVEEEQLSYSGQAYMVVAKK